MKRVIYLNLFIINLAFGNVLDYINSIRVHSGLKSLKYSKTLSFAAKKHAVYLKTNYEFGHSENAQNRNFYAAMPWSRILKAGFGSKAVVENISFGEINYKASVDKIMATVYHRLAFLDTKVDSLGFAKFNNIYVYDMGNSKISSLCKKSFSNRVSVVEGLCRDSRKQIPLKVFRYTLNRTKMKSKSIITYPYPKQKNVSISLANERPKFTYKKGCGFPISVTFNKFYYRDVKLKKFELKSGNRVVPSIIVTFRNDIAKKLKKGTFILLPLHKLKHYTRYSVILNTINDGKYKKLSWSFTTH